MGAYEFQDTITSNLLAKIRIEDKQGQEIGTFTTDGSLTLYLRGYDQQGVSIEEMALLRELNVPTYNYVDWVIRNLPPCR